MADEFIYREFGDDEDGAMNAAQDQTRARALDLIKSHQSFILTVGSDGGEERESDVESISSFRRMDPRIFSAMLQATTEAVAASWFANNGNTPESFAMLTAAFLATARQTMREVEEQTNGGEG